MPSRKQRRRRQKERRHDYEYVYVDDEGHEVEAGEFEPQAPRKERRQAATAKASRKQTTGRRGAAVARPVPAPSWRRVARRAAIFAPFMFVAIWLLGHNRLTTRAILLQTIWLIALFVPFSYVIDRMMYRRYVRQTGSPSPPAERQRRA